MQNGDQPVLVGFPTKLFVIREDGNGSGGPYFYAFESLAAVRQLGLVKGEDVGVYELREVKHMKA